MRLLQDILLFSKMMLSPKTATKIVATSATGGLSARKGTISRAACRIQPYVRTEACGSERTGAALFSAPVSKETENDRGGSVFYFDKQDGRVLYNVDKRILYVEGVGYALSCHCS